MNISSPSHPDHAEGVYIIRNLLRYGIATKERMESSRSDVWHQSEGEIHAGAWCHTVAKRRITCNARGALITYQSFGLDKKRTKRLLRSFFGRGRRTRTHDPWFWRPVLYQLSYTPVQRDILYHTSSKKARGFSKKVLDFFVFPFSLKTRKK